MRSRVRLHFVLSTALVAALGIAGARTCAQSSAQPVSELPNPYRQLENWAQLPAGRVIGATSAIEIDRDGTSVWVFERCGGKGVPIGNDNCIGSKLAPLIKLDSSGKLIASFGAGMFAYPHGIDVDHEGNIWVTDGQGGEGKGQQVFKFSPAGKVLLTLGKAGVSGEGPDTFNRPSDVVVAPNGDIFVADGHGETTNDRIVKFSKDGKFIKAWGKQGSGPGEFNTTHNIAMDAQGRLFVADRGNNRIQIFDQDGKFLAEWKQFGNPSGLYIDRNDILFSVGSLGNEAVRAARIGSVRDGKVIALVPDPDPFPEGVAGGREGVAVDRDGNIYISKTGRGGVFKFVKQSFTAR